MELEGKTKTEVVVAVVRRVVVAVSHTAVPGVVVPATAPVHTVGAHTDTVPLFGLFFFQMPQNPP